MKVIAELSANHLGSLDRALALVDAAADAGAWAVKLQTWDRMVLDKAYTLVEGPWTGRRLFELYEEAKTPWEWHQPIFERAIGRGLVAFSSVFDIASLEFLQEIRCPMYKIASFEVIDLPLIRAVAATRKPIIMSTGMATLPEIEQAVQTARAAGAKDITILKCTSAYPADPKDCNLRTITHLQGRFPGVKVGLSDHTRGIAAAVVAASLGATMIEKHLTLARADGGVDAEFSAEPAELASLVRECAAAAVAVGEVRYQPAASEGPQLGLRRSLYFARDMRAGTVIERGDLITARPALGLEPRFLEQLIGNRTSRNVAGGSPAKWTSFQRQK